MLLNASCASSTSLLVYFHCLFLLRRSILISQVMGNATQPAPTAATAKKVPDTSTAMSSEIARFTASATVFAAAL
jgi:hypothetical protein